MIDTLPVEVIFKISNHLQFKEKLNLVLTCRRLHGLISRFALYKELNLFKYGKNAQKIVGMFNNNPLDGSQVQVLCIKMLHIPEQLRSILPTVFPNVSRIKTGKIYKHSFRVDFRKELDPSILSWIKNLRVYDLYNDWPQIFYSLRLDMFPYLSELRLGHAHIYDARKVGLNPLCFAPVIKNAPSLTKLTLYDCDISLELLEQVHNGCLHIKTLRLEWVTIVINNHILPENMVPANGVLNLEVYSTASIDKNGIFLDYILKKYINLQYLVLDLDRQEYSFDSKLLQYFPDFFDSDSANDSTTESNEIVPRLRRDFLMGVSKYLNSSATFFSSLPKAIKTLKIDIKLFNGIIDVLSKSDMKLTELDFCDANVQRNILKSSHQLQQLYKMKSLKTLKIPINSSVQKYVFNCASPYITRLVIVCHNGPLHIDWVFAMFPSLQDLYIKHSKCDIEIFSRNAPLAWKTYPNLQSLCLRKCSVHPSLIPYLKRTALNMTTLKLDQIAIISESKERVYNIDISDCNLKQFRMSVSSGGYVKKLRYYHQLTIKAKAKELVHASWGDSISITQNNDSLGRTEDSTYLKDIEVEMVKLKISDSLNQ